MLSSRYLHLHEALGLGPMWLNRNAEVRPSEQTAAPVRPAAPQLQTAAKPVAQAVRSLSPAAHHARMAATALAAEKKPVKPTEHKPSETVHARTQTPVPNPENTSTAAQTAVSDGLPPLEITVRPSEIMVVSICPSAEDSLSNRLFSGNVGTLLDNMLAAVGKTPQQVHKTCWVKSAPMSGNPTTEQIQAAAAVLADELQQSGAKAVLFLGQIFEQAEQQAQMQAVCGNTPYFTVPHPARLLRQPLLKAQAWTELKKLKRVLQAR